MFLPVKASFQLPRFPILTVLICLICTGVFLKQQSDWHEFSAAMDRYCNGSRSHIEAIVFERIGMVQGSDSCADVMYTIANDPERNEAEVIYDMATSIRPLRGFNSADSVQYVTQMLEDEVRRYNTVVPEDPDTGLAYYTGSWNPWTMITSNFAHGDWMHIVFNLVFFFAFAATVEVLVGSFWFTAFVLVDAWFIGITGSLAAAAAGNHYWTLGLSGIVMGMMGLFAYLLPKGKIKCYYFFIVIFGSIAIPGWMLAAWYIGGDVISLITNDDHGVVNVMAHVMGGIGGYLFGLVFLREIRKDARDIQYDLDRQAFETRFR
ncbi:MAG: rhomboid family intramembrane serine protease [Gammaproteobacteria bacterium]|nr:rhomboid family intramembrane serine protease [Gammaproteobacteria bacterium]